MSPQNTFLPEPKLNDFVIIGLNDFVIVRLEEARISRHSLMLACKWQPEMNVDWS